jgi:endonuclease G
MTIRFIVCLSICLFSLSARAADIRQLEYDGFTVWLDCSKHAAVLFHYVASKDTGKLNRKSSFSFDPDSDLNGCQQFSTDSYQSVVSDSGVSYDLGHQVPANHLDHSAKAIAQSNYMTNILPQTLSMNRGAWRATEDIIECLRDETDLEVWGGPLRGSDRSNDYFVKSHGLKTPDHFWKVVIRQDTGAAIGWIIPNAIAGYRSLDSWIRTISQIENASGMDFDVKSKRTKPLHSWPKPKGCKIE